MSQFVGILGAPCFFTTGLRYSFSSVTKDDFDAVVSSGPVKVNIPNPVARAGLTGLYPSASFVDGQFAQQVGSYVYTISPSKRTVDPNLSVSQSDYETGKMFKITMDSKVDTVPNVTPSYVWGNRMMNDQESGTYTYHALSEDSVVANLKAVQAENIYVGHESTVAAIASFRGNNEVLVMNRASYPQLKVGEATVIVVPKGVNVGGTVVQTTADLSAYSFFLLVREA